MAVLTVGVGYIGAQLVTDLLAQGEEVVAVDNLFSTDAQAIARLAEHPRCLFIRGSLADRKTLAAAFDHRDISTVFCLAAQASAHPRAAAPRYTEFTNLLAPRILLDAMRRHGVRSIVFASSLRVYGETVGPEASEDAAYGVCRDLSHLSKCYVEKLMEMYASVYGLRCLSARLGIVYGLSPVMKTDYRFITAPNKFCLQVARNEEIIFHSGSDRVTGFVGVSDVSGALRAIASCEQFDGYVPVNVGTEYASVVDVAAIVAQLARDRGLKTSLIDTPSHTTESAGGRLSSTGFRTRQTMRGCLGAVIDYFCRTPDGSPEARYCRVAL